MLTTLRLILSLSAVRVLDSLGRVSAETLTYYRRQA
jgi:hypothetical protein